MGTHYQRTVGFIVTLKHDCANDLSSKHTNLVMFRKLLAALDISTQISLSWAYKQFATPGGTLPSMCSPLSRDHWSLSLQLEETVAMDMYMYMRYWDYCSITLRSISSLIAKFMGPTWGPPGSCRPQVGPCCPHKHCYRGCFCFRS